MATSAGSAISASAACPCGSGRKYKRCCGPLHQGQAAKSPEALMRSRYSAYALGLIEYVIETTHPRCALARRDRLTWAREIADFCTHTRFEALEVLAAAAEGDRGEVSFRAQLSRDGRDVSFAERSTFVREPAGPGGRWLYLDGDLLDS